MPPLYTLKFKNIFAHTSPKSRFHHNIIPARTTHVHTMALTARYMYPAVLTAKIRLALRARSERAPRVCELCNRPANRNYSKALGAFIYTRTREKLWREREFSRGAFALVWRSRRVFEKLRRGITWRADELFEVFSCAAEVRQTWNLMARERGLRLYAGIFNLDTLYSWLLESFRELRRNFAV